MENNLSWPDVSPKHVAYGFINDHSVIDVWTQGDQGSLLLTWFNFDPSMDK